MSVRSQARVQAPDLATLIDQVNTILSRLQSGGLLLNGLRLDATLTAAPSGAPGANDPNLRLVTVSGTVKLELWDGSAWVVVGTQS